MKKTKILSILFLISPFLTSATCSKKVAPNDTDKLQIFQSVNQESLGQTIWHTGDTTVTNEDRLDLFRKSVENRGGGYIGVGSSQNLSIAAWGRSEWVWLMDFTSIVVAVNRINVAFLRNAPSAQDFRRLWSKAATKEALQVIEKEYRSDPDLEFYKQSYLKSRAFQNKRFRTDDVVTVKYDYKLWMQDPQTYRYIRDLAIAGRIKPVKGDLRGPTTVLSIAKAAGKMKIPIRIIYYSNAEEYFDLDGQFRKNWTSIPVDDQSMIVRTISVNRQQYPWAPGSEHSTDRGFHYNVMPAQLYQEWLTKSLPGLRTKTILKYGVIDRENGFSKVEVGPPEKGTDVLHSSR